MSAALEFEPDQGPHPDLLNWPLNSPNRPFKKAILVTNSSDPLAIGDAIASLPAILAHAKWAVDAEVFSAVIFSCPQMHNLFELGIPQFTPAKARAANTKVSIVLDTQEVVRWRMGPEKSLVEMYGEQLGESLIRPFEWPSANATECEYLTTRLGSAQFAILAPFCHSDNGTQTKIWPEKKWIETAGFLRETGLEPVLLCTNQDDSEVYERACQVRVKGRPIQEAVWAMQNAALVITADNGMGWLAQSLSVPHVQILSSNMPPSFAFDFGVKAQNVQNCQTASALKVWEAVKRIREF